MHEEGGPSYDEVLRMVVDQGTGRDFGDRPEEWRHVWDNLLAERETLLHGQIIAIPPG